MLNARRLFAIVMPILIPSATLLSTAAFMSIPPDTRGVDIAAGGKLFADHCRSCHFAKPGLPSHAGPNLHEIGKTAAMRKPSLSASEYLLESILDPDAFIAPNGRPGMPRNIAAELAPHDIRNLLGFLASLGTFPDYDSIKELEIPDRREKKAAGPAAIRLDEMQLAEFVLREKGGCLKCHQLDSVPESVVLAPGLFGVGLHDTKHLYESLTQPHKKIRDAYKTVKVVLVTGHVVSGQLLSRDEQLLVVRSWEGTNQPVLREILISDIERENGQLQMVECDRSLMPEGLEKSLTREEIDAVIKLIRQLN